MVGKGSVNHNSRKFKAANVDGERSHLNIDYCNEDIKAVYHNLFDEALERYNVKQTRADRKIENYYEKIRSGKQEKPFHEVILQIGDKDNMSALTEDGQLAKKILDEYYRGFQERNPNLRVFSAHLHMDEATPHIHIDFVPFTTGSKRGLDTRVSLKQALAAQGFKGGTRGDTEWNQWVQAEKERLAEIMLCHGIEWEQKSEHREHLSVLEYKREQRTQELAELTQQTVQKAQEYSNLEKKVEKVQKQNVAIEAVEKIEAKPMVLSSKVTLERSEYESLTTAAKKYVAQEKKESKLQKALDASNKMITELKNTITDLTRKLSVTTKELSEYKSVRGKLRTADLEQENARLRSRLRTYEDVISHNNLWHFFGVSLEKKHGRGDNR